MRLRWTVAATYFVRWLDDLIASTTAGIDRFAAEAERDEVPALYRKARAAGQLLKDGIGRWRGTDRKPK